MNAQSIEGPELLTIKQFCQRFGCHRATIYRLAERGCFNLYKLGGSTRLKRSEVEHWANNLPFKSAA